MTGFRRRVSSLSRACALAAALAVPLFAAPAADGAIFTVTNTNDSGDGSLRQALDDAATQGGANTIDVQAGLGIIDAGSELRWCASGVTTINGNGVEIDMNGSPRGLVSECAGLDASRFTITGVGGSTESPAAPVMTLGAPITLTDCNITGNVVTVTTDEDAGGGVNSEGGAVALTTCTITDNVASSQGGDSAGGVQSDGGVVTVSTSVVDRNSATSEGDGYAGGGINSRGGAITIAQSSVSSNSAVSTAADDSAAGGVQSEGGDVTSRDSTVNCNVATATEDAGGAVSSEGGGVTFNGGDVIGNSATSTGGATAENTFNTDGGPLAVSDVVVSDDRTICSPPPPPPPPPGPPVPEPLLARPRFTG